MPFKSRPGTFKLKPAMLWPAIAVAVGLLAAWTASIGWRVHRGHRLAEETTVVRRQIADRIRPQLKAALDGMRSAATRPELPVALQSTDPQAAEAAVRRALPKAEAVEFFAPGLDAAYADPGAFGYSKLALLNAAAQRGRAVIAVVKDTGSPHLALAAPVLDKGRAVSLAYARLPLDPLKATVSGVVPEGAYVALRQGYYNVVEAGAVEALRNKAEAGAIAFDGTSMRVVAAAPLAAPGWFGLGGAGEAAMAVLLVLAAVVLWRFGPRMLTWPADSATASPTLWEMQHTGQIVARQEAPVRLAVDAQAPKVALDRSIFRAYDIRGVVGQTLDADVARLIGQAIGTVMAERGQRSAVVGRDGRLSSPAMAKALIEGLRKAGRDVIDIGPAPTPLVYFGTYHLRTGCGVAVTGSHNPPDYNGFKIVVAGETLSGEAIHDLYARIAENRLTHGETLGQVTQRDIKPDYIARVAGDIQIERKLKVVIDCGSGIGGILAPELLEAIGAQVEPLYCEVDGTFPHHHPDPSDPANMQDLMRVVQRVGADIGLALDGDGDRLGVVTKGGEMIYADRLLMLFAADVLERNPGACVIYDVKCTGHLASHILRHGGSPLMWKTGHSLIKSKMKEVEAELAGEMSGHFFFRERWYGFDDGAYAAARLLEILASRPEDADAVFATLPHGVSTPEMKVEMAEGEQYRYVDKFVAQAKFEGARVSTIDGLRADWPDGWGLVRASNTTPVLVLRFDADNGSALARIQDAFRERMLQVDPDLKLPF